MKYYKTTACVHIPELRGSYPAGTVIEITDDDMMRIGVISEPVSGGFRILQRYGMVKEITEEEATAAEATAPIEQPSREKMPVEILDDTDLPAKELPSDNAEEEEEDVTGEEDADDEPGVKKVRGMRVEVLDEQSHPLPAESLEKKQTRITEVRNELPEVDLEAAKKEADARKAERRARVMENLKKAQAAAAAARAKKAEAKQSAQA